MNGSVHADAYDTHSGDEQWIIGQDAAWVVEVSLISLRSKPLETL